MTLFNYISPYLYTLFKKFAFLLDPEFAHRQVLKIAHHFPQGAQIFAHPSLENSRRYEIQVGDLTWSFPVGLAAGLDKDALAVTFFSRLLWGAIEVGTVTPHPQSGNPRPRLFRLPREESLRNQMGFNNQGMEAVFKNLIQFPTTKCLGVNLGKNKRTKQEEAAHDYQALYEKFAPIADYLVMNVSSPNTPGLRNLQKKPELEKILHTLGESRKRHPCPLFIKLSPDMDFRHVDEVIELADHHGLAGLIATNTAPSDDGSLGGISGKLLFFQAKKLRAHLIKSLKRFPSLQLIGVGGFSSFKEIKEYWEEGGRAVQIYTSFIYQGPPFLMEIKEGIDQMLQEAQVPTLERWFQQNQDSRPK